VELWIERQLLNWETRVQIPAQPKILKWKIAWVGAHTILNLKCSIYWINRLSLIIGYVLTHEKESVTLSKYSNPAFGKVDEMRATRSETRAWWRWRVKASQKKNSEIVTSNDHFSWIKIMELCWAKYLTLINLFSNSSSDVFITNVNNRVDVKSLICSWHFCNHNILTNNVNHITSFSPFYRANPIKE